MVASFLAFKSLLQISSNLMRQSIISLKFMDPEFYFILIIDIISIYLGLIIVKRAACSSMQILLFDNSKSFIIRL